MKKRRHKIMIGVLVVLVIFTIGVVCYNEFKPENNRPNLKKAHFEPKPYDGEVVEMSQNQLVELRCSERQALEFDLAYEDTKSNTLYSPLAFKNQLALQSNKNNLEILEKYFGNDLKTKEEIESDNNSWYPAIIKSEDTITSFFELTNANMDFSFKTKERFTKFSGSKPEVTMLGSIEHLYIKNDFAEGFVKPLDNKGDLYFVGILPLKSGGFNLLDLDMNSLLSNIQEREMRVTIPEIRVNSSLSMNEPMMILGLSEFTVDKLLGDEDQTNSELNDTDKSELDIVKEELETVKDELDELKNKIESFENGDGTYSDADEDLEIPSILEVEQVNIVDINGDHMSLNSKEVLNSGIPKLKFNRPFAFMVYSNELEEAVLLGKITNPNSYMSTEEDIDEDIEITDESLVDE